MATFITYPTGNITRFDNANYIQWIAGHGFFAKIWRGNPDKEGSEFIATVPNNCIVSFCKPAVTINEVPSQTCLSNMLEIVVRSIRTMRSWKDADRIAELKTILKDFHIQRKRWMR